MHQERAFRTGPPLRVSCLRCGALRGVPPEPDTSTMVAERWQARHEKKQWIHLSTEVNPLLARS